jgi:hypothetical protein
MGVVVCIKQGNKNSYAKTLKKLKDVVKIWMLWLFFCQ